MRKLIIDRFEGSAVVCETKDKQKENLLMNDMPDGVKEGDCLVIDEGKISIDKTETDSRKEKIKSKLNNLWK